MPAPLFLENENDVLKRLATDAIYQFVCIFEREAAMATQAEVPAIVTPVATHITEQPEPLAPPKRAEPLPLTERMELLPTTEKVERIEPLAVSEIVTQPLLKPTSQFRNLSNLKIPLLQTNVLEVVQKKLSESKSLVGSIEKANIIDKVQPFTRVVPKLSRSSSLLSQQSNTSQNSLLQGRNSSLTNQLGKVEVSIPAMQPDVFSADNSLKESLQTVPEEVMRLEQKQTIVPESKATITKSANPVLQNLADIRKGLAASRKKIQSRLETAPSIPETHPEYKDAPVIGNQCDSDSNTSFQKMPMVTIESSQEVPVTIAVQEPIKQVDEPIAFKEIVNESILENDILSHESMDLDVSTPEPASVAQSPERVTNAEISIAVPNIDHFQDSRHEVVNQVEHMLSDTIATNQDKNMVLENLYSGTQTSFLVSKPPVASFLNSNAEKIKPEIKALQQAALAAKKEQIKRAKLKETKEERAKQVLERKKELEKQKVTKTIEKRPLEKPTEPVKKKLQSILKPPTATFSKPIAITKPVGILKPVASSTLLASTQKPILKPKLPVPTHKPGLAMKPKIEIQNPFLPSNQAHKPPSTSTQSSSTLSTIVDDNGDIIGIDQSDSDSSADEKTNMPIWASSPMLRQQLRQQTRLDPDSIFETETLKTPNLKDIMGHVERNRQSMYQMASLTEEELQEYKNTMGY